MNGNNNLFSEVILKEVEDKMSELKANLHRNCMNIFFKHMQVKKNTVAHNEIFLIIKYMNKCQRQL